MPTYKTVLCDFFRVEVPDGSPDLQTLLQARWAQKPQINDRNMVKGDDLFRIGNVEYYQGPLVGTLLRLRRINDARIGFLDNEELQDLQLQPGETLTEFLTFMYIPQYKVVILSRNRDAGGHGRFEEYLEWFLDLNPVRLAVVQNLQPLNRLNQMDFIQNFEIKIANPQNLNAVAGDATVRHAVQMAQQAAAASTSVTMSAEKTGVSLAKQVVTGAFGALINHFFGSVEKAIVTGRIGDEHTVIDLVKDRMREYVQVERAVTPNGSALPIDRHILYGALNSAFEARHAELGAQFAEIAD